MEIQLLSVKNPIAPAPKPLPANLAEELAGIWETSVTASHDFLRPEDFSRIKKELPRYLRAAREIWLAPNNSGFLGCDANEVEMLFIRPDCWGRGLGSALLAHARDLYGPLKITVNEENLPARKFYARRGFKIISRSELDDQGRCYPILHMAQD